MVKVQVRVDDQDTPQFSRLATLAGVSPPIPEADLHSAEQRQQRTQSRRDRSNSKAGDVLISKLQNDFFILTALYVNPSHFTPRVNYGRRVLLTFGSLTFESYHKILWCDHLNETL